MSVVDFERALQQQLNEAMRELPTQVLQMKMRDFLQLSSTSMASQMSTLCAPETPKTATRKSAQRSSNSVTQTPTGTATGRAKRNLMTPRAFNPLLPQTPANHASNIAAKRPRLTIKAKEDEKENNGIVQFQLTSGKIVDVDFSRSPQSALAEMESADTLQEVKAKIETYATHFMQYLKFFKKLQPNNKK